MKTKHQHVIEATVTLTQPFDPADLPGAGVIQHRLVDAAKAMVGFRSVTTRMTKVPVDTVSAVPADGPALPGFLKAK